MNTLRDEKMYLRARIGRNIKCPKCNTSYRTDNRRSPSRRAPVLLSCGHSCCETCSQSSLLYICSLCSEKTRVVRGQLPKHLYIFGLVAESYSLPINLDRHLEMRLDPIRMFAAKEHMKEICQECSENKASLRCRKCLSELCDPCFKKIHAHKTMKKHTAEPLHSVTSAYLRPPCASHPEVIVTHVCYTCSTEVVGQIMFCTTCFVFGPHLQHDVVEFSKLAEQYMTEVKVGIEELTGAIDQLEESRLRCEAIAGEAWREHGIAAGEMQAWTHRMHGLLQHVEETALANLHAVNQKLSARLAQMVVKIDDEIMEREALRKQARSILNGNISGINLEKFVKHLKTLTEDYPVMHDSSESKVGLYVWEVVSELEEVIQEIVPNCIRVIDTHDRFSLISKQEERGQGEGEGEGEGEGDRDMFREIEDSGHDLYPLDENADNNGEDDLPSNRVPIKKATATSGTFDSPPSSSKIIKEFEVDHQDNKMSELHCDRSPLLAYKDEKKNSYDEVVMKKNLVNYAGNYVKNSAGQKKQNPSIESHFARDANHSPKKSVLCGSHPLMEGDQDKTDRAVDMTCNRVDSCEASGSQFSLYKKQQGVKYEQSSDAQTDVTTTAPTSPFLSTADDDVRNIGETGYDPAIHDTNHNFSDIPSSRDNVFKVSKLWRAHGARPKTCSLRSLRKSVSVSSLHSQPSGVATSIQPSKNAAFVINDEVIVTHIQNPSVFYIQRLADAAKIQLMSKVINLIARESDFLMTNPVVGKLYLAQYTKDNVWYRAVVTSVAMDMKEVFVKYVDYGNSEVLRVERLKPCPPEYKLERLPSYLFACGLWEILPARGNLWDSDAINVFAELVNGVQLKLLHVKDRESDTGVYQMDLWRPSTVTGIVNDGPLSIREVLIFLECAIYVNFSPQDRHNKQAAAIWKRSYFRQEVPFGEDGTSVLLSSLTTPHDFCLQLASYATHLNKLMQEIQKHYRSPKVAATVDWRIYAPRIGMPCVALYTGDDKWYRAVIEDIPGKKQVDVRYVDYGNKERLWYKQIYKITEDFLKLPAQAIKCRLQDINPIGESWPKNAADHMATICDNKELKAFFHNCDNDECIVSLMICSQEPEDVGEQLMELGIAEAPENFKIHYQKNQALRLMLGGEMMQDKRQVRSKRALKQLKQIQAPVLKPGAVCAGKRCVLVEFLTALSVCRIQIRLASQAAMFRDLQNQLDEELNQISQPPQFKPVPGELCAVRKIDAPFCARARIIKCDLNNVQVLLVDCGGMEWVKLSQVLPLPEKLAGIKNLALIVSLAGIAPPMGKSQWPGITFDRLKEELSTRSNLYMKRKGRSVLDPELGVKVMPVELGWMQEEVGGPFEPNTVLTISINELLIECGVALPAKSVQPDDSTLIEKSSLADSTCTLTCEKVLSCEDFCLQEAESLSILSMLVDQENISYDTKENTCKRIKQWLPSPLPAFSTFNAIPSYIDYEGVIYLQPVANSRTIELMRESQTIQFTGTVATDEDLCWSPGDPVVAMFHLDKKWYRATVLQKEKDGNVKVQFVDYGNEETVMFSQLRQTITFSHIPIQCHKAVLHGIVPSCPSVKWETKLLDFIHSTIVEKECRVQIVEKPKEDGLLRVNLVILDVAIDLSSLLVDKMRVCRRVSQFESLLEYEDNVDVIVENDVSLDSILDLPLPVPALKLPSDPSEVFPIRVTSIKDPSHIYIAPVFPSTGQLSATQKLAEESFKANTSFISQVVHDIKSYSVVSNPVIGEMYLGKSLKGEWCRVQVKKVDPAGITVLYIDRGNVERIPQDWLVMCPSDGKKIPASAVCVKLHCVEPRDGPLVPWDEDALKCLSGCFMQSTDKSFHAVVKEEGIPNEVEIYRMDEHGTLTLAYADAVSKGLIVLREKRKE